MANPQILGQLVAATLQNMTNKAIDNISRNNALYYKLNQNGSIVGETGGYVFREKLLYGTNTNVQAQSAYSSFNTNYQDYLTYAEYGQKVYTGTAVFNDIDVSQNSGPQQLVDLVKTGIDSLLITLANTMGTDLFTDGSNPYTIEGLQLLLSKTPTSGVVGGIDRAANVFWRNKAFSFAAQVPAVTPSSSTIQDGMNSLWIQCQEQSASDLPDILIADGIFWDFFRKSLTDIQRVQDAKKAEAGFEVLLFKSAEVSYDPNCPASTMYFVNSKHMKLKYLADIKNSAGMKGSMSGENSKKPMVFSAAPATRTPTALATIHPIVATLNLTIDNCRTSGVLGA